MSCILTLCFQVHFTRLVFALDNQLFAKIEPLYDMNKTN